MTKYVVSIFCLIWFISCGGGGPSQTSSTSSGASSTTTASQSLPVSIFSPSSNPIPSVPTSWTGTQPVNLFHTTYSSQLFSPSVSRELSVSLNTIIHDYLNPARFNITGATTNLDKTTLFFLVVEQIPSTSLNNPGYFSFIISVPLDA